MPIEWGGFTCISVEMPVIGMERRGKVSTGIEMTNLLMGAKPMRVCYTPIYEAR